MIRIPLFALALILSGCANVSRNYKFDPQKPIGLAIGTITYESSVGEYGLVARAVQTGAESLFRVGDSMWSPLTRMHDDDLKSRGGTFAVELAAGEYRLVGWQVRQGYKTSTSSARIDIPFTIEQGKATYIGNLHFSEHWDVSLRDRVSRDLPVLKSRFEALNGSPLAFAIGEGTNIEKVGGEYTSRMKMPVILPIVVR